MSIRRLVVHPEFIVEFREDGTPEKVLLYDTVGVIYGTMGVIYDQRVYVDDNNADAYELSEEFRTALEEMFVQDTEGRTTHLQLSAPAAVAFLLTTGYITKDHLAQATALLPWTEVPNVELPGGRVVTVRINWYNTVIDVLRGTTEQGELVSTFYLRSFDEPSPTDNVKSWTNPFA